jgi:hypothetical protein
VKLLMLLLLLVALLRGVMGLRAWDSEAAAWNVHVRTHVEGRSSTLKLTLGDARGARVPRARYPWWCP